MSKQGTAVIIAASSAGETVCASAGRISTTQGTALEIYERSKEKENNGALIEKVVASGHQSLVEHAVFTVAFDSVSVCVEEFVIEFRLASFTVQSRRYVDFTNTGCYVPALPESLSKRFETHMNSLFGVYANLLDLGIPKEDARFVLPYCFRSNFYCTLNARELIHMISAMLWGRGSAFPELAELGRSLKTQFEAYFPNLLNQAEKRYRADKLRYALPEMLPEIPEPTPAKAEAVLQFATPQPEEIICAAAGANGMIVPQPELTKLTLKEIVQGERPRELELVQANFTVRNLSLAAVTHLVRHRMQSVLVPQIMQAVLKNTYLVPPTIAAHAEADALYRRAYAENTAMLRMLLAEGLPVSAVQYFALAGNQLDVICGMNGRELQHFFALRTCNRAQWEIRACAKELLMQLRAQSPMLYQLMGPSCYVTGICPEGRLSCGKLKEVQAAFS